MINHLKTFLASTVVLGLPALALSSTPPAQINVEDFPATVIDEVIVPEPSEVFVVLDKLTEPDWHQEIRTQQPPKFTDRYRISLLMGTTIADGFVAVQAQDAEAVKKVGQNVLELSEAIGVRNSVLPHAKSIIEAADESDWVRVREELDKAQQSVREAMEQLKDEQLAQLISIGGWLRGTEVLTNIVQRDYSADSAELLRQPDLMSHFLDKLGAMSPALRKNPLVPEIEKSIAEIKPMINVPDGREISAENVARINQITKELVRRIESDHA